MTLLQQIQNEVVGSNADLAATLRKCRILAQRLRNDELKNWVHFELDGYPTAESVPDYRVGSCHCYGTFFGTYGRSATNVQIPLFKIPENLRDSLFVVKFTQGVVTLQDMITHSRNRELQFAWPADICAVYGKNILVDYNLAEAWSSVPAAVLVGILDTVRNRVLNFVLEIESENPNAGEAIMTEPPILPEKVQQIFHTHIAGNVGNFAAGSQSFSQVATVNVQQNDFESLQKFVQSIGGTDDDCHELQKAIKTDGQLTGKSVGRAVATWLGGMVAKAAQGMLKIGEELTAKVISEKLKTYYGI